jgi:phosphoribosyl 1,2-cyclic phosphodiesterase
MSLELCVLGSGSAGNCAAVRAPVGTILIDAGLGPRTVARRMCGTGVAVADVGAICLTHLDRDHFSPAWARSIVQRGIRVHVAQHRVEDLLETISRWAGAELDFAAFSALVAPFDDEGFSAIEGLIVRPIALAHDDAGSHGFFIEGFGSRLGYATDLGRVPAHLIEHFADVDVLALECNYDPKMQLDSARPWFLKNRIMGGRGHLSNQQAFEAIQRILDRCERRGSRMPGHIVLLHRSRECNCPQVVRKLFARDSRVASRLTLAEQYQRSEWLRAHPGNPRPGEQLVLAFA